MLRGLIWLAVLGGALYIGSRYAGPHVRAWRFRDAMNQTARLSGTQPDEDLRLALIQAAHDLDVPLRVNELAVRRNPNGSLELGAAWREVVRLHVLKWERTDTLHFAHEVQGVSREPRR